MLETADRFCSKLVGYRAVLILCEWLRSPSLAFHVLDAEVLRRLRADPTFTYHPYFANFQLQKARFALQVGAYEWAWVSAKDAIFVCQWHERDLGSVAAEANSIRQDAEAHITAERLEDLREKHQQGASQHKTQFNFKEHTIHKNMLAWQKAMRGTRAASLKSDRPLLPVFRLKPS
jgi:hypothetical protein